MTRDLVERFTCYSGRPIAVQRVALCYDQVQHYRLPPNPAKEADPRADDYIAEYGFECWELDAIEPRELQRIVSTAISSHIDMDLWNETRQQIEHERENLRTTFSSMRNLLRENGFYAPPNS